ncbi:tetratricopeptide repeat protein [Photobacterium sanguinicancri]|uniref:tetratricopeptide repeat protein n=1 Tax=Photobacterium sanguinicancri TaxID=875932 RepID=UPI003D0CCAE2
MTKEEELIRAGADAIIAGDWDLAVSLFTEAYSLGSGSAAFNLSEMYKTGMGVVRDHDKQQYWLDRAKELGFVPKFKIDPKSDELFYQAVDASIANDWNLAVSLYTEAYNLGNGSAAFNLSEMYKSGKGVAQDHGKHQYWLERSKELGYIPRPSRDLNACKSVPKPKKVIPKKQTLIGRVLSLFRSP